MSTPNKPSGKQYLLLTVLLFVLLALQARLWLGQGSIAHVVALKQQVRELEQQNRQLEERNRLQAAEVDDLKHGLEAVEEVARKDLGMIKEDESFFKIVDGDDEQDQ